MESCQKGDLRAFESIYRHFEQPLLNLGLRMLGRQEDVEDALQTTFLKLYRSIGKFKFDSKLSTYLFRIMMNVCFDFLKKNKRMKSEEIDQLRNHSYKSTVELRLQLEEAIHALPERTRACFVLFAVQELKQSEVAEVLNVNLGTVKAHVFNAKSRLRALLTDSQTEVQK